MSFERLEIDDQVAGHLVTVVRMPGHHAVEDLTERIGHAGANGAGRIIDSPVLQLQDFDLRVRLERDLPGHEMIKRCTEGIEIAAGVGRLGTHRLLVRHVVRRAEALPRGGEIARLPELLGKAEVGELHDPGAGAEDVLGLDVAMDNVTAVSVFQGAGNVEGQVDRVGDAQAIELVEQGLVLGPSTYSITM